MSSSDTSSDDGEQSQFIASSRRTVHRGTRETGAECGTQQKGQWASIDAADEEEAVMRYNLAPCTKCIDRSLLLSRWRTDCYSATVIRDKHVPEWKQTPEKWKRYAETGELEEDGGCDE